MFEEYLLAFHWAFKLRESLMGTNSSTEKKKIIKEALETCPEASKKEIVVLDFIFNKHIKFNITSSIFDGLEGNSKGGSSRFDVTEKIIQLLMDKLADNVSMADFKVELAKYYKSSGIEGQTIMKCILDHDFGCGVSEKTYRALINTEDVLGVSLADHYEDGMCDFVNDEWYASRKLDGVRLNVVRTIDGYKTLSREGREFTTLSKLIDGFDNLVWDEDFVLDGEVITSSGYESDDFTSIVSQIKRKNYTIEDPMMLVFDLLTVDEAYGRVKSPNFKERIARLKKFMEDNKDVVKGKLVLVEQTRVRDTDHLQELVAQASGNHWEGVMLRKNTVWKGKRSKDLLKVKKFKDEEFKIVGYTLGDIRYVSAESGDMKTESILHDVLTSVKIDVDGSIVGVGSGFTISERQEYANNPESLIGRTIKVKYFERTKNKDGGNGLRFPIKLFIYESERFD